MKVELSDRNRAEAKQNHTARKDTSPTEKKRGGRVTKYP